MGQQIVKQPNGQYAVWSSVVDDFVMVDASPQDIIADQTKDAHERIYQQVQQVVRDLDAGGKPYHQFTRSFDECVATIREQHGDDAESLELLGLTKGAKDAEHSSR